MSANDPFAPLSRRKKIGYAVGSMTIIVGVAVLLGAIDGGFTTWQLLRVVGIVGIPMLAMLALIIWLSGGKRSEAGIGSNQVKFPIRFLKALPYLAGLVIFFYIVKAIDALFR